MNKFKDCVAVVTGAGSGIGRQLSYQLGDLNAKLAISDINADNLEQTRAELQKRGVEVFSQVLDVSDEHAVFAYAEQCRNEYGTVNLVINNAGVALGAGPLWETPIEEFKWLMGINFYGVLSGTKAFLPMLQKAQWGHVVNISSIFGIIGVPEQNAYNASKFAVRGMTEALRQELKLAESTVSCTSVHPGGIKTNIARNAKVVDREGINVEELKAQASVDFDKLARTTPESAAQQILKAVEKDKARLLIGLDAKFLDLVQRLMPVSYPKLLKLLFGNVAQPNKQ
jgi:short-subunit dehydrogenase